ncbi:MAG: uncharacterized protein JWM16_2940, partial [Verrucomicrobiales bacterium]|nr:uncharacterized protein [Verrucomicrobiales bacterium]
MRALLTYLPKFLTRGALLSLATLATAAAMAQTVTTSTNFPVGLGISDGSAVGIASFKSVTTPVRFITGLQVGVKISGTFNGDLYCYLVHNSGFSVLLNRPGRRVGSTFGYFDPGMDITFDDAAANGDVHNYRLALNGSQSVALSAPLSGVWRPDGRTNSPLTVLDSDISRAGLSSFQGLDPNGDWLLFVADLATGDLHLLDNWSLTITGYLAPTIGTQPADQLVQCSSGIANFNVSATGSGTLSYQWRLAGVNLSGATNASLSITNPASAAAGAYDVVVTGSSGSVTSSVATLTIVDMTAPVVTLSGSPTVIVECHGSFTDPGASALDACAGPLPVAISGAVNANVPGVYTLTYSATDPNGNVGTATRTVTVADTIAPVVTLVGSSAITVECHGTFVDPGATAMDTCAGAVSVAISGAVDANVPGLYTLTYSATDPSGKTGTATRTVTVSDTTPPIVSLIGNAAVTVECHGAFTDPGATATDACAGALTPTRTGSLDLNTPGVYTLTYSATDPSGKTGTATRTVTVSDTTPPIVTLVGNSAMTVECHDAFTDPGATALDTCAGAVSVTVGGTVNANVPGVYTLTYSATDPSGKTGTATRTVTVSDTTPPMVTLIGSAAMTVECHGSFTDPGATATDVCAGALTATRTGTFDANTPGVYTLTYSATDPSGKTGTATRTVTVSDTIAPVVTLVGSATMTVECHGTFTDPGATAVDACAGTLPIATNGSVTANIPGVYTLTYSATDPSGKTGTATRTVTVSDTTAPVVTLVGSANMTVECHGTFTDPGATAADACAGALTPSVSGSVSVNTPGVYTLTYSATDPSGKTGTATRTVTVSDTVPPVVTLVGNASITVECHGSFVDPGATALDACAGSLSVATSGSVNANVTGVYTLIYSATDPSGKTGTATRTVTVSDTTPPVVTLAGSSSITVECHGSFVDPGATALDTCA